MSLLPGDFTVDDGHLIAKVFRNPYGTFPNSAPVDQIARLVSFGFAVPEGDWFVITAEGNAAAYEVIYDWYGTTPQEWRRTGEVPQ